MKLRKKVKYKVKIVYDVYNLRLTVSQYKLLLFLRKKIIKLYVFHNH